MGIVIAPTLQGFGKNEVCQDVSDVHNGAQHRVRAPRCLLTMLLLLKIGRCDCHTGLPQGLEAVCLRHAQQGKGTEGTLGEGVWGPLEYSSLLGVGSRRRYKWEVNLETRGGFASLPPSFFPPPGWPSQLKDAFPTAEAHGAVCRSSRLSRLSCL